MKKLITAAFFGILLSHYALAQSTYLEAGFLFGLTNYSGDVAESSIELKETKPGFGAYLRYQFGNHFSAKTHVYAGSIVGDDANASSQELRDRSFKFSTNIIELGVVGEWNFLSKERASGTGLHKFFWTPYVFGGIGTTFANAESRYYTKPDRLNDFINDPSEFGITQHNVFILTPVGIGFKADFFDRMVIGIEGGWRPVYSDKLDGIALNGNPDSGDWYYFAGTTISFILSKTKKHR